MDVNQAEVFMSTEFKNIRLDIENQIATLTVNRPDKLNALNENVLNEIKLCVTTLDKSVQGLILIGSGEKAFIAGADIQAMSDMRPEEGEAFSNFGQQVTLAIENVPIPVIAAVNGFALGGGCEFALAADFIYATKNAVFGLPEVKLGLLPGFGGTQRLAKIIGVNAAKEFIYTGRNFDVHEAQQLGLVSKVFDSRDELIQGAKETLLLAAKNSRLAISQAKKAVNEGVDLPIEKGLSIEKSAFKTLFESEDVKEGTTAFLEKRKPQFNNY
jgi:enoyl-CoA hydratase